MGTFLKKTDVTKDFTIEIEGVASALRALDIFQGRVRSEAIFEATRSAMTPYVAEVKQAAVAGLTTLSSKDRRKMASSIGIKAKNIGKRGKAISWAIVGPVMGRELSSPRKRLYGEGTSGQFDFAKMAGWFGGKNGVKPHQIGSKGGMHPGIPATPVWEPVFIEASGKIIRRFNNNLTKELQDAVKDAYNKTQKRQARQQKAFLKATGGGK